MLSAISLLAAAAAVAFLPSVAAHSSELNPTYTNGTHSPFQTITINASDNSISASFIPYAATLTNLYVPDRDGVVRDVVLGYDNRTEYITASHPNFGSIVGRYANRIKNGSFSDPATGETFQITLNENGGLDSLHGGIDGWSWRVWTVTEVTLSSISFAFFDPHGKEGFPGNVISQVKYSLHPNGVWNTDIYAQPTARTPLLLSSHVYWNFDGFSSNSTVKDYTLHMPFASQVPETDTLLVPTGPFINVSSTAYNFLQPRSIGWAWNETLGYSGLGKLGYDTCWINEEWASPMDAKLIVSSPHTGIQLSVTTDQRAIQIYSCGGMAGTEPRKASHGGGFVQKDQCMVIEMEDVIDAINNPEWGIDQWYSPSRNYEWHSSYAFSTV